MAATQGYGQNVPSDSLGPYNPTARTVMNMLARVRTVTLGMVKSVQPGGTGQAGTVSVQPLVSMVDGNGNVFPHGTIYNAPYLRLQGGANAVIVDPAVDDVGILLICDRDISSAKKNLAPSAPPTGRTHDMADALYLGAILGPSPNQFLRFTATGMELIDVNGNTITTGPTGINLQPAAGQTVTIDGIVWETHLHGLVATGTDDTGPPL
jgi:hypothetical protein